MPASCQHQGAGQAGNGDTVSRARHAPGCVINRVDKSTRPGRAGTRHSGPAAPAGRRDCRPATGRPRARYGQRRRPGQPEISRYPWPQGANQAVDTAMAGLCVSVRGAAAPVTVRGRPLHRALDSLQHEQQCIGARGCERDHQDLSQLHRHPPLSLPSGPAPAALRGDRRGASSPAKRCHAGGRTGPRPARPRSRPPAAPAFDRRPAVWGWRREVLHVPEGGLAVTR